MQLMANTRAKLNNYFISYMQVGAAVHQSYAGGASYEGGGVIGTGAEELTDTGNSEITFKTPGACAPDRKRCETKTDTYPNPNTNEES
jgi:hypothetical protein